VTSAGQIQVGIIDPAGTASPLLVDGLAPPFTAMPVRVTLTKAWTETPPPGWPTPPGRTGADYAHLASGVFPSGTTLLLFANVAAALIAANAATAA